MNVNCCNQYAFSQICKVLKRGKYLTVAFHSTNIRIYNSIHKAAVVAGFDVEKVLYQPPARASAKQLLQPYGSAKGNYYIRFRKPIYPKSNLADEDQIDIDRYERIIIECVKKVIAERGEPTPYSYIINSYSHIYTELSKNGYRFTANQDIEKIMKKYSNIFIKSPKKDLSGKTVGYVWWFTDPSSIPFIEQVPLSERVEQAVINVLNKEYQVSFDKILQEIFIKFPNALTPETLNIYDTLKIYAEKIPGGKWRLKPEVERRVNEHNTIVEYLCEVGEKSGYQVYGDISNRRQKLTFNVPDFNLSRIHKIDVLWFKDNKIYYEFEVENTTSITDAIVRGSNIPTPVKRIMLLPEERENLLARKIKEYAIAERLNVDKWMFVWYDDFYRYYHTNKNKRKLVPSDLEKLNKPPTYTSGRLDSYISEEK